MTFDGAAKKSVAKPNNSAANVLLVIGSSTFSIETMVRTTRRSVVCNGDVSIGKYGPSSIFGYSCEIDFSFSALLEKFNFSVGREARLWKERDKDMSEKWDRDRV